MIKITIFKSKLIHFAVWIGFKLIFDAWRIDILQGTVVSLLNFVYQFSISLEFSVKLMHCPLGYVKGM